MSANGSGSWDQHDGEAKHVTGTGNTRDEVAATVSAKPAEPPTAPRLQGPEC